VFTARVIVATPQNHTLEVADVMIPDPGPHQVVIDMISSGVCHSQLHQLRRPSNHPVVLGHEGAGVVSAVGASVQGLVPGDPVLLTWIPRHVYLGRKPVAAQVELADGTVAVSRNIFTWADRTITDEAYVVKLETGTPRQ
jgi:D-arabinose 1-dehydrogenase-like Zn-dependent alcohol dehydrogenase